MAKQFAALTPELRDFIARQTVFFTATAAPHGRVNVSPKGMDTLRVAADNRVVWLNLTGSGNETAAHLLADGRITLMWCALEGQPMILRLYGRGRAVHPGDEEWGELIPLFPPLPGARQVIVTEVELVQTSCGYAVPLFDFVAQRDLLTKWSDTKGETGVREYWNTNNRVSLDGLDTGIIQEPLKP
ncbi:MAG: pyridoxamine 5'-phosphate oxidase family protein [Deltaproteobacteria bacterium]|nr:pyridoxamine 5'-phosphate oxidase family protein [Deltaproteobacteria bacterium]